MNGSRHVRDTGFEVLCEVIIKIKELFVVVASDWNLNVLNTRRRQRQNLSKLYLLANVQTGSSLALFLILLN